MDWAIVLKSILALGGLALILGAILAIAYAKLAVKPNPQEEAIRAILPGANCGACGFAGCDIYAEKVAKGEVDPNFCLYGGPEVARQIGKILGKDVTLKESMVAALICPGGKNECKERYIYDGGSDCRQAYVLFGGNKSCVFGCVGLGHCASVCPFGAIRMDGNRLPKIDEKKCTGCGICVKECPKNTLMLIPRRKLVYLACVSHDKGRDVKNVCSIGCIACNICIKVCPYDALRMENNLPVMDFTKCTDCGICYAKCPTHSFIDRARARPYAIITPTCNGCGECVKVCQFKAIEGEAGKRHRVITEKCIGCGECFKVCPVHAITMAGALGHQVKTA
jgi:Na+-translocating ferredoxin:NAD+ oxidoreductase RNF subunit RnfB